MICRLCLININTVDCGVSLFNDTNGETLMVKIIAKYLHLLLTQNDIISTTICQNCCDQLDAFHKFCSYVEEQQSTLRNNKFITEIKPEVPFNISQVKEAERNVDSKHPNKYILNGCTSPQKSLVETQLKCEPEEQSNIFSETVRMPVSTDGNSSLSMEPSHPDFFGTQIAEDLTSADYDAYRNLLCRQSNKTESSIFTVNSADAKIEQQIPAASTSSFLPPSLTSVIENVYIPSTKTNNPYEGNGFTNILFSRIFFKVIKQLDSTAFQQKRGGALVQCCFCDCKLKGSTQVTSNLIRHLKLKHAEAFEEYKRLKANCKT